MFHPEGMTDGDINRLSKALKKYIVFIESYVYIDPNTKEGRKALAGLHHMKIFVKQLNKKKFDKIFDL